MLSLCGDLADLQLTYRQGRSLGCSATFDSEVVHMRCWCILTGSTPCQRGMRSRRSCPYA
eukprot:44757-Eustigmatos_ZCMA.PRE.1